MVILITAEYPPNARAEDLTVVRLQVDSRTIRKIKVD